MRQQLKNQPYIFPLLGLAMGFIIVGAIWANRSSGETFRPSDAHIVYLFDKGERQVLDTKAKTVGELISRLNLGLIKQDVIEPAADTPIVEDNFRINIYHARPVTVVDGATRTVTLTAQRSPRVVVQDAGLKVKAEDLAKFAQGSLNENVIGEKVVVSRATPIKLNLYGTQVPTYTLAKTVAALLDEKRIQLNNGEKVNPALDTPIKPKMQVFVLSKGTKVVTIEESIPAPTKTVNDASLSFGSTAVRQPGSPGKKLVTYLITGKKGRDSRKIIQQAIVDPPVTKIIARGTTINITRDKTAVMKAAGIRGGDFAYVNFIIARESNWNTFASNASGAYGLCQALPGSKMVSAGGDWRINPITQLRWCSGYASGTYGSWAGAYNFWLGHSYW